MPASNWAGRQFPALSVFDSQWRHEYVRLHSPERLVNDYLNARYGRGTRVCYLSQPYSAGIQGDPVLGDWHGDFKFHEKLAGAATAEDVIRLMSGSGISRFVVAKANDNRNPAVLRLFIDKYTEPEFDAGDVYLAKLKPETEFGRELLTNGDFSQGLTAWSNGSSTTYKPESHSVLVTAQTPLVQQIQVDDRRTYRYSIRARCSQPNEYVRCQVNWLDRKGQFINGTIRANKCGANYETFRTDMVPPAGAGIGIVYASGHGSEPVEVSAVSLRGL